MYFFFYDDQIDALYLVARDTMENLLNYPDKSVFDRYIWFIADIAMVEV